jgi:hypothetical protein
MKHLLTGVAMAAALAIAAPAWAQTPGGNNPTSGAAGPFAPSAPAAAPMTPPASAPAAQPMAKHHHVMHHPMMHHVAHHRMGAGDATTDQLNAQELQRIQSGAPPAAAPASMMPGGNNPTTGAAGPFAPSPGMSAPPPPR